MAYSYFLAAGIPELLDLSQREHFFEELVSRWPDTVVHGGQPAEVTVTMDGGSFGMQLHPDFIVLAPADDSRAVPLVSLVKSFLFSEVDLLMFAEYDPESKLRIDGNTTQDQIMTWISNERQR